MISENTAKFAGGTMPKNRFYDLLKDVPEETRTSAEIIRDIRKKIQEME
jgi:hypothetical protein